MEANLAEYLDMTCATVGGAWWVTTEGKIIINPNNEVNIWKNIPFFIIGQTPLDGGKLAVNGVELLQEPVLEQVENPFIIGKSRLDHAAAGANLTDKGFIIGKSRLNETTLTGIAKNTAWAIEKPTAPPLFTDRYNTGRRSFYYIDLGTSFASNETVSEIVVENHTAIKEDNSWNDSTKTYKASDNNIAAIYGQSARSVKANASTAQNAQQLAEYLLKRPQEQIAGLKVSSVQMNALNCSKTLAALDLFDYCQVRFKEETSDHQIYAFESQLTPYTWKERLYLTPAKKGKSAVSKPIQFNRGDILTAEQINKYLLNQEDNESDLAFIEALNVDLMEEDFNKLKKELDYLNILQDGIEVEYGCEDI
ncbi:hypothetical protein [Mobiluncus curtisii]|uniref:Uncharacterized protein n=1 Tax=Mobiluncus curtisii TaxID=2051 RepID=A0A2X3BN42_9ACTO|nr:hypothetical protein [Mobiluncus curtisii]SQC02301.1 Uncharacterised protein [Mobiluncus curtisii]